MVISPTEEHEVEFGGFGKVVIEESSTFGFDAIGAASFFMYADMSRRPLFRVMPPSYKKVIHRCRVYLSFSRNCT